MKERELFIKSTLFSYISKILILISSFLYTFFIANYFSPEEYGLINFYLSFAGSIVLLFGSEAISETLLVFTAKTKSKNLFFKLLKIQLVIVFIIFIIFFFSSSFLVKIFQKGSIALVSIIAFTILFIPFSFFIPSLFKGFKSFGKVLQLTVIEALSNLLAAFFFVFFLKTGLFGIIYAKMVSIILLIFVFLLFYKKLSFATVFPLNEVINYIKNSFIFNFLKKIHDQIILFFIGLFITPTLVGFYFLLDKIANYAIEMPLSALNETLLPFASSEAKSKEKVGLLVSRVFRISLIIATILSILFLLLINLLLNFFFPAYISATKYSFLFALVYFLSTLNILSIPFKALNRVDILSKAFLLMDLFSIIFGFPIVMLFSLFGLLLTKIIAQIVFNLFLFFNLRKLEIPLDFVLKKDDISFIFNLFKKLFSFKNN